eukprot:11520851-Alexandrium_andersonii.AAC.1
MGADSGASSSGDTGRRPGFGASSSAAALVVQSAVCASGLRTWHRYSHMPEGGSLLLWWWCEKDES